MEDVKVLYIMDSNLRITEVKVENIDECKFAMFYFEGRKCNYWLKGATVQTKSVCGGCDDPKCLVSSDKGSLAWVREFVESKVNAIGSELHHTWTKIFEKTFN